MRWLVPIVVGANWPEGDEDALRRLADAWERAATVIGQAAGDGTAAVRAALDAMRGETADSFRAYWDRFAAGDEQFLGTLQQACRQLADGCATAALDIEYTKLSIIAVLLILAAQIAAMVAAAGASLGVSTAGVPIVQTAARITVQTAFRELISQLAVSGGINVGVDALIQFSQRLQGVRSGNHSWGEWNLSRTVDAGIAGMAAGVAGSAVRLGGMWVGTTTMDFGAAALRGAGEGALAGAGGNYLNQVAHADLVPDSQDLVSGVASGGIGGALGGTASRHEGLDQTWFRPETSSYTAGPNTLGWRYQTSDGADARANAENPYTGSWNSGDVRRFPTRGGPNTVNADEDDYRLPAWPEPDQDT